MDSGATLDASPRTLSAASVAASGGVLLIVSVFLTYYSVGSFHHSLLELYARLDVLYILLGAAAVGLAVVAVTTGRRAALSAGWAVGLVSFGLTWPGILEDAFHYGELGVGFWLAAAGAALIAVGFGGGLVSGRG
jgi:hypothetical protein